MAFAVDRVSAIPLLFENRRKRLADQWIGCIMFFDSQKWCGPTSLVIPFVGTDPSDIISRVRWFPLETLGSGEMARSVALCSLTRLTTDASGRMWWARKSESSVASMEAWKGIGGADVLPIYSTLPITWLYRVASSWLVGESPLALLSSSKRWELSLDNISSWHNVMLKPSPWVISSPWLKVLDGQIYRHCFLKKGSARTSSSCVVPLIKRSRQLEL